MPLFREPQADRTLVDATAAEGSEWCYVVRAVAGLDPVRESAPSNEVCLVLPRAATQATP